MSSKHPEDFMTPIQSCFDLLKLANIGFYDSNQNFFMKHWRSAIVVPFLVMHFICMSFYMRTEVLKLTISHLAFMTSAYIITVQVSLKGLIIIKNKKKVEAIVNHLGGLWKSDSLTLAQRERKTSFLKRLNVVRKGFYWSCLGAAWQNLMTPLFLTALQYKSQGELQLPFGYVLPFQLNVWRYIAVYSFQCYTMLRLVYIYLGTELLKIVLCAYLSIEFMLLQEDLKCVSQGKTSKNVIETIKKLARKHQVLLSLSDLLNDIFNQMIFFDLVFATMTACFFAFAAITCSHDATLMASNLTAVSGILFPIYIYCYYSAVLGQESSGVADAVYEDLWHQGNTDYQKTICFIIARAQHPCYLKALKSVPLTVLTFTRVVSTTWSYLSLAINLYSE